MLPAVLGVLEFRSNNLVHRPVLDAVDWLRRTSGSRRVIRPEDGVPLDGVVPPKWRDLVVETDDDGRLRINRINCERSEERRVGQACASTLKSRWSPEH